MKSPRHRRWLNLPRNQKGAAAVEFALVLPVLLLLILGGMDMGHMFYMQHVLTNASREGARFAAKYTGNPPPSTSAISTYIKSTSGLNYDRFNFNDFTVTSSVSGGVVTVTVQATKNWWFLNIIPGFSTSKTLTASTAMVIEGV